MGEKIAPGRNGKAEWERILHLEGIGRLSGQKSAPGRNGKAGWVGRLHLEEMGRLNGREDCTWKEWEG